MKKAAKCKLYWHAVGFVSFSISIQTFDYISTYVYRWSGSIMTLNQIKRRRVFYFFSAHEGLGNRGVNEIATGVYLYIEELSRSRPGSDMVFYSDNCGGPFFNTCLEQEDFPSRKQVKRRNYSLMNNNMIPSFYKPFYDSLK